MNSSSRRQVLAVSLASLVLGTSSPVIAQDSDFYLADYMNDVVMESANVLWEAVYPSSGPNGEELYVGPDSEEGWQRVEAAARSLVEASDQLKQLPDGWLVRDPTIDHETPTGELSPEQIVEAVRSASAAWSAYADVLRTSATQALNAAQQRDAKTLFDITGVLDAPCTSCHTQFWYPNSPQ